MFSILRIPFSARRLSPRPRRPRRSARPQRLRPALWLEFLEDRTLLSSGPLGGGPAMRAAPLDPAVPGHFAPRSPQPALRNATVAIPTAQQTLAAGAAAARTASPTPAAGQALPESVFIGGFPGGFQTPATSTGFNPFTGQSFFTGNPAANFLRGVPNSTNLANQVPPSLLTAQVGTTSLPTEQGLLTDWMFRQHNLPLLLGGGGGANAMLGPNTQDNPRANPGAPALQPNGEQEEPAPAGDNTAPSDQSGPSNQPASVPAPVTDGDDRAVLLTRPSAAEKLPGWEIIREKPAEVAQPVPQAAEPAPETPAPLWVRVLSAVSFAAGAVGAVWVPKFGATGMSREDLLALRRRQPA
jgi:hypothetical protein